MATTLFLDPAATSLQAAQANTLASSSAMVTHLNSELKKRYLSRFNDWTINVLAGKIDNSKPPQPPNGYELITDDGGFSWPERGETPVCEMPPVPADYSKTQAQLDAITGPNHISIGKHLDGAYWASGGDDTCQSGFITPPLPAGPDWPEGAVFQKIGFFMGKGWWLKVN